VHSISINFAIAAYIPNGLIHSKEVNKSNVVSPVALELLDHALLRREIIVGREKKKHARMNKYAPQHNETPEPPRRRFSPSSLIGGILVRRQTFVNGLPLLKKAA
jgi:hypothetical protein